MNTENIDLAIKMLSEKLDLISLPEHVDHALTVAKDLETLETARLILKLYNDPTYNDQCLIASAMRVKIWNWADVYTMIPDADSEETKKTLKNIAGMLYDHDQDGRI